MRNRLLIVVVIGVALVVAACSESEDLATFNSKMFNTSMSSFKSQWEAKNAEVLKVSVNEIERRWDSDEKKLDLKAQKDYWFDVSTDFCSSSPDTGPNFDFKAPCVRHDFGWRNLKKLDAHWASPGAYSNTSNKRIVNNQFLSDMNAHCATRSIIIRQSCYDIAAVYYAAVSAAA